MIKNLLIKKLARAIDVMGMSEIRQQMVDAKILSARSCINCMKMMPPVKDLADSEFQVFSQFGDDGILQYLIHHLDIPVSLRIFVEFGVENYEESNTRFLLFNNNWKGMVIDGSNSNIDYIKNSQYFWKYDLTALAAFIDADNINGLISSSGISGDIGILSVDIDGNDYSVWEKINVISPIIVVAEYNGIYGSTLPVSVPYDPQFRRTSAHYSNLYWGCSLAALNHLADKKGYIFAGCNSAGNNAYFIRKDYFNHNIPRPGLVEGFVDPKFKESRNSEGELTFLSGADRLKEIKELPLINVVTGEINSISQLYLGASHD